MMKVTLGPSSGEVDEMPDATLSLILFSGSDDKLQAASVLAVGAAAMERKVNVFLQYWALDCFRNDRSMPARTRWRCSASHKTTWTHWSTGSGASRASS